VYFADNLGWHLVVVNMHKDFNVSAKAVDDDDIKLNYKSLRGNGGIAVFWKKTIDNAVTFVVLVPVGVSIIGCVFC
jgi:hypothetical protein